MRVGRILLICLIVGGLFAAGYGVRVVFMDGGDQVTAIQDVTESAEPGAPATAQDPAAANSSARATAKDKDGDADAGDGPTAAEPESSRATPADGRQEAATDDATAAGGPADSVEPGAPDKAKDSTASKAAGDETVKREARAADDPPPDSGAPTASAQASAASAGEAGSAGDGARDRAPERGQTGPAADAAERRDTTVAGAPTPDGSAQRSAPGDAADVGAARTAARTPRAPAQPSNDDDGRAEAASRGPGSEAPTGRPAFDVVRVEPGGAAVIAGRAEPNSSVTVLEDGKPIGTAETNPAGEFVVLPGTKLSVGRSELTLKSTGPSGGTTRSADAVVIATPPGDRGRASPATDADDGERGASADAPAPKPFALKVPRAGSGGARVMQQPRPRDGADADAAPDLAFRVVQYTNRGGLVVSGTASDDWRVRVMLDGRRLGKTRADPGDGQWSIIYRDRIPAGLYTLKARALGDGGEVVARATTPFASQPDVQGLDDRRLVVVQPGSNLWTIARRTYGQGVQYTTIYNANQDQIADPDLIYPGQVFVLPGEGGERAR
jgi:nucleoid-associated protein YgaU